ncbi:MAG: hypothetical protein EBU04_08765 [Verrucomicrobia bacterium]|nr:hypothetical protein [Verrucomicrobiota bacterium]
MKRLPILFLALLSCIALSAEEARKPNVIFILADDLGAHDLGCFGSTYYETPNIDRLSQSANTRRALASPHRSATSIRST